MKNRVAALFKFRENHTDLHTEIIAGCTTFLTMVYIVVVCPSLLKSIGMNPEAVFSATCCAAALGSLLMGLAANYPVALAPSMSLLGYFAYSVVQGSHIAWQEALGLVFIAGVIFFLLTLTRIRQQIVYAISPALKIGITVGIGLFLGVIALKNLGFVSLNHHLHLVTPMTFSIAQGLCLFGVLLIFILDHWRVPGAILIGILALTATGVFFHFTHIHGIFSLPPSIFPIAGALQLQSLFHLKYLGIIFTFVLVALFDNTGTLIAVLSQANLIKPQGDIPRLSQALAADSIATMCAAWLGVSSVGSYIESSAGVRAGGRTGFVSVVVALLFLSILFFSPLVDIVPPYATSAALLYVALQMLKTLRLIPWKTWDESMPAMIIALAIPLTFSIAEGIGIGLIFYGAMALLCRQWHKLSFVFVIMVLIFSIYLIYV